MPAARAASTSFAESRRLSRPTRRAQPSPMREVRLRVGPKSMASILGPQMIDKTGRQRQRGEGRVRAAIGSKCRGAGDIEVSCSEHAKVAVDDSVVFRGAHPRSPALVVPVLERLEK